MSKISVVTISFNNCDGLQKTINSVLAQKETGADIEYIVIDGASTDNTKTLLLKYEKDIDILICEPDTGIYNAMNKGLNVATGDSIVFMNSGDFFYEKFNLKEFQNKYDFSKTIFTYTVQKFDDLKFVRPKYGKTEYNFSEFGHQGVYAPKTLYKVISFDESRKIDADYFWQKNLWEKNNFVIADEITACFELGGVSNNYTLKNTKKMLNLSRSYSYKVGVIIKYILQSLLGVKKLYKLLYSNKYGTLNED